MTGCPFPHKIRHDTRTAALAAIRPLRRGRGGGIDLTPYPCPAGGHWHTGNSTFSLHRRIRRALRRP